MHIRAYRLIDSFELLHFMCVTSLSLARNYSATFSETPLTKNIVRTFGKATSTPMQIHSQPELKIETQELYLLSLIATECHLPR